MEFIIILGLITILTFLVFFSKVRKRKRLLTCDLRDFSCFLRNIEKKDVSEKEKIIDYDKLYHKVLLKAWYQGGFWDILKKNPKEVHDINKIWDLHKVRNYLVHEMWYPKWVSLVQVAHDYKKEVKLLLKKFS
jgi:hypothetical protein